MVFSLSLELPALFSIWMSWRHFATVGKLFKPFVKTKHLLFAHLVSQVLAGWMVSHLAQQQHQDTVHMMLPNWTLCTTPGKHVGQHTHFWLSAMCLSAKPSLCIGSQEVFRANQALMTARPRKKQIRSNWNHSYSDYKLSGHMFPGSLIGCNIQNRFMPSLSWIILRNLVTWS